LAQKLEGGPFFSKTLRDILDRYHGAKIGKYSYGAVLSPGLLPHGSEVGAYCSIGMNFIVRRRNHPIDRLTQHPFFYNSAVGLLSSDSIHSIADNPLVIGNDVWIGDSVIILAGCRHIGDGAVVGAGAVVTKDVEAFSVVVGAPARPIRRRYEPETEDLVRASQWWLLPVHELLAAGELLTSSLSPDRMRTFCDELRKQRDE